MEFQFIARDRRTRTRCIRGAKQSGTATVFLWLGNSQLHAINQFKPGDVNAPPILFDRLRARNEYLVTFSEPNASLQEQLVLFSYLLPRLEPKALILPIVFDDFRESRRARGTPARP